eukprot:jgi/Chrzof1/895/Cz01g32300.t1
MALYIGLDLGTQGAKALVYDASNKQVVARGSHPWNIIESSVPGRAEQDPATWIEGSLSAIKAALSSVDRSKVRGIGVSGQQHGLVALDKNGEVLCNAKLWCDTESTPEAVELSKKLGTTLVPSFTAAKILWLKRNEPELYAHMEHVLLPHDYMNYYLTGRMVMEAGDASGTGLYDTANRCWDRHAMSVIDDQLHTRLPDLIGPDEAVGTLTEAAATALGLDVGVVVAPGSGDNAMSALGAGVARDGEMVVSLGTSGTLFGKSATPIIDPSCEVCPFCDATGAWLPLVCTLNCTKVAEEVRQSFGLRREDITALAAAEPPGCQGVNYLPYVVGERTPNWPNSSGAILGIRPGTLRPGLLYRAAFEGATFSLRAGMQRMTDLGLVARELRLVGGGSNNKLWQQIVADVFQLPIRMPLEAESAALGAALQAAAVHSKVPIAQYVQEHQPPMAEQVIQPSPANKQAYDEAFARHVAQGRLLFGGQ